ncbi:serine threonine- kinase pim-2-like protein [Labeo rohita]|uniref:non-specific serine/threonine protein kinase n=1 Tax=Labeo rohita TaxID=84645 RepID=A0A498LXM0_LABRO|nr:serine threonine- kinase pim-2-like protein [Labeo rohita]RXN23978.1 serine threonine- kinase pim-2-like protein [Labeo rohita]
MTSLKLQSVPRLTQATVCDKADSSDDVLQTTVCATSDCNDGIPLAFLCPMSCCSDDVSPSLCSDMSYCCDDIFEATICGTSGYNDDIPASSSCDMSYCSDDVLEDTVCTTSSHSDDISPSSSCDMSDCSVDVPQDVAPQSRKLQDKTKVIDINFCCYEIGSQLGKGGFGTVYAATRLDDGLQVALKFVSNRNKKFFIIDGFSRPFPLEVALLILASQDPSVPEIVQLLDWRVEPDHYVLVLEHPIPFEELNWFVLWQTVTMEEDVAQVIMHQAIFAAQTCCRRGVLHRDIKMENLLINPDTLEVKLIDFGCGDFLTNEAYTTYAGTREYCPPEYLMTGKYHREPATVWSLRILLFALLCGDYPKIQDLKKINSNTWAKEGLSKECCDIIRCCLQIDPQQRIELGKLCLHNWFKTADKKK